MASAQPTSTSCCCRTPTASPSATRRSARAPSPATSVSLAATTERWDDAERHFEQALEFDERIGARPWLARTQHDYAQMLLARDASGDTRQAELLFTQASAAYQELGMAPAGRRQK